MFNIFVILYLIIKITPKPPDGVILYLLIMTTFGIKMQLWYKD